MTYVILYFVVGALVMIGIEFFTQSVHTFPDWARIAFLTPIWPLMILFLLIDWILT